jgi:hypothetical protein
MRGALPAMMLGYDTIRYRRLFPVSCASAVKTIGFYQSRKVVSFSLSWNTKDRTRQGKARTRGWHEERICGRAPTIERQRQVLPRRGAPVLACSSLVLYHRTVSTAKRKPPDSSRTERPREGAPIRSKSRRNTNRTWSLLLVGGSGRGSPFVTYWHRHSSDPTLRLGYSSLWKK